MGRCHLLVVMYFITTTTNTHEPPYKQLIWFQGDNNNNNKMIIIIIYICRVMDEYKYIYSLYIICLWFLFIFIWKRVYIRIDMGGCSRIINNTHTPYASIIPVFLLCRCENVSPDLVLGRMLIPNIRIIHELIRCVFVCVCIPQLLRRQRQRQWQWQRQQRNKNSTRRTCISSIPQHSIPSHFYLSRCQHPNPPEMYIIEIKNQMKWNKMKHNTI